MLLIRLILALLIGGVIGFLVGISRPYRITVTRRSLGAEVLKLLEDADEVKRVGKDTAIKNSVEEKKRQIAEIEAEGIRVPSNVRASLKALEVLKNGGTTEEAIASMPDDLRQEYFEWSDSVMKAAQELGVDTSELDVTEYRPKKKPTKRKASK